MRKHEIAWTGHEIGSTRPTVKILSPKGAERLRGVILCERQVGAFVHWDGSRNVPCTGLPEKCDGCSANWQRRWRGYLAVAPANTRGIHLIEYTDRAAERLATRLTGRGPAIKNCAYTLFRRNGAQRGEVILEIGDVPIPRFYVGNPPDLYRLLLQAWIDLLEAPPVREVRLEDCHEETIPLPGDQNQR